MPFATLLRVAFLSALIGCEPSRDAAGLATRPDDAGAREPNDPNEADAPSITTVSPSGSPVGSPETTIELAGVNFLPRSVVRVDGVQIETTYVSATTLFATIGAPQLARVGELGLTVATSAPGGGISNSVVFAVGSPMPRLEALEPLSVPAGAGSTSLVVKGGAFAAAPRSCSRRPS